MKNIIISVSNSKGGSAKTTSTAIMGFILSEWKNKKVLIVDMDQQNQIKYLMYGYDNQDKIKEVKESSLSSEAGGTTVRYNKVSNNLDFLSFGTSLVSLTNSESVDLIPRFKKYLKSLNYDFILVDNPPAFQSASNTGVGISDYTVISTMTQTLSYDGSFQQEDTVNTLNETLDSVNVKLIAVLRSIKDRNNHNAKNSQRIKDYFQDLMVKDIIPSSTEYQNMVDTGVNDERVKERRAIRKYLSVVDEIMERISKDIGEDVNGKTWIGK